MQQEDENSTHVFSLLSLDEFKVDDVVSVVRLRESDILRCVEFYDSNHSYLGNIMLHHVYLYKIGAIEFFLNGSHMFLVQISNLSKENRYTRRPWRIH
jgi:hypothetical protein